MPAIPDSRTFCERVVVFRSVSRISHLPIDSAAKKIAFYLVGNKKVRIFAAAFGKLPEWSIGPHSKCGVRVTVPGVRIPHFPQQKEYFFRYSFLFFLDFCGQLLFHLEYAQKKMGKLSISHRYNLLPLLLSGPGGIQRELVV